MICFPNAKINIGLFVTEKRTDGYHNLETIFYPVPIEDALEILPASVSEMHMHGLHIAGNAQDNLVWKAWTLLHTDFPDQVTPVSIQLLKQIPMGAGMGGGSADGAFMLQLLNRYFKLQLSRESLLDYALHLGSDCPFFIYNEPCYASGRGEQLEPITLDLSRYSLQVICPELHIATAAAFQQLRPQAARYNLRQIQQLPVTQWKDMVRNDFEPGIFAAYPQLAAFKSALYHQGALYASMSGTGSTIYGLFEKGKRATLPSDIRQYYFE